MSSDHDHKLQAIIALFVPLIVVPLLWVGSKPYSEWWPLASEVFPALLTGEILVASLVVAQWYRNLHRSREIARLQHLAFSYRLGETLALRPFRAEASRELGPKSSLVDYRKLVKEPEMYLEDSRPLFFLALFLVLALGLMPFWARWMKIAETSNYLLGGPVLLCNYPQSVSESMLVTVVDSSEVRRNRSGDETLIAYQTGALVCLSFAFLGAYLWAITYLFRRITLNDVTPNAYQTIAIRLLGASIVALMFYHVVHLFPECGVTDSKRADDPLVKASFLSGLIGGAGAVVGIKAGWLNSEVAVLASFLVGVMPEATLRRLMELIRLRHDRSADSTSGEDLLRLERIEGIDVYTRMRLAEVGIYDAHGLVSVNPIYLYFRAPFNLAQVMDWIGQAFALIYLQPKYWEEARQMGIRTAWQIEQYVRKRDVAAPRSSSALGPEQDPRSTQLEEHLRNICKLLLNDPAYLRAREIVKCMRGAPRRRARRRPIRE